MESKLDGLQDFHFLLYLQSPPKDIGAPEFVALLDEDVDWAHGQARVDNAPYVFEEMLRLKPDFPSDYALAGMITEHETTLGIDWGAPAWH